MFQYIEERTEYEAAVETLQALFALFALFAKE